MTTENKTAKELIKDYLFLKLDKVMKKPYGNYKYPFVDPGSAYDGNLWDWDTFWAVYAMIGVDENCKGIAPDFKDKLIECGKGNVLNFLNFQLEDGNVVSAKVISMKKTEERSSSFFSPSRKFGSDWVVTDLR